MERGISFNIYVMSYQRADRIMSKDCFEYCTYVVRECEAEAYRDAGVDDMLVIPNDAKLHCGTKIWNFMTTLWWIIENTPEDIIFIADDDIDHFVYRLDDNTNITIDNFDNPKRVTTEEIERIAQLLVDLNLGFACDNPQPALYVYDREISFKGQEVEEKKERLRDEIDALERGEFNYWYPPNYINKVKRFLKKENV